MRANFDIESTDNHFERYTHVKSELIFDTCPNLKPTISIMIPTFKRPHLIKDAIDSAFNQKTDVTFEVVVVDNDADCEFENELKTLISSYSNFNIRYYRNEENIGMFGNWNRCIELARATRMTILNDDDLLHPDFIAKTYDKAEKSAISVGHTCFSEMTDFHWENNNKSESKTLTLSDFFLGNPVPGSLGLLMFKEQAICLGGYNPKLWPTSDYDFSYRYSKLFAIKKVSSKLAAYRWQDNESLKVSTLEGFLSNDIDMRRKIIESGSFSKLKTVVLRFFSDIITVSNAVGYNRINRDFDVSGNISRYNFSFAYLYCFLLKNRAFNKLVRYSINNVSPLFF
ncbi:glycosyltransferase family 2 protein [Vibrio cholerae]